MSVLLKRMLDPSRPGGEIAVASLKKDLSRAMLNDAEKYRAYAVQFEMEVKSLLGSDKLPSDEALIKCMDKFKRLNEVWAEVKIK